MSLITVLSPDDAVIDAVRAWPPLAAVTVARRWERLDMLALDRPVTDVIFDGGAFDPGADVGRLISDFHHRFPSIGLTFISPGPLRGQDFLEVGKLMEGRGLYFPPRGDIGTGVLRGLTASARRSATGRLLQSVGRRLGQLERTILRTAMTAAILGWDAERFARHVGYSRPHFSARLKLCGLPSAGHLLLWAKLMHAGHWLADPGRTGQSVARQLDYANGATFRRALRSYVGATPTEVVANGGFYAVCHAFLDVCDLGDSLLGERSVA